MSDRVKGTRPDIGTGIEGKRNRGTDGWEPGEGQERGQGDTDRDRAVVITTGTGTGVEGQGQIQMHRNRVTGPDVQGQTDMNKEEGDG